MQGAEEEALTARRERTLARSEYPTLKKRKRDNKKWESLGGGGCRSLHPGGVDWKEALKTGFKGLGETDKREEMSEAGGESGRNSVIGSRTRQKKDVS